MSKTIRRDSVPGLPGLSASGLVGRAGLAEPLEPRRLLAAVLDADLGILTITGGDEKNIVQIQVADTLDANTPATSFAVLESTSTAASPPLSFPTQQQVVDYITGGTVPITTNFSLAVVRELRIVTGGGDDLIILGNKLPVPASIDSGAGNDSISAGIGDDTLDGSTGNDYVFGHDSNDNVSGGIGADEILGGDGFDTVDYKTRTSPLDITFSTDANDGESGENDNVRTDIERAIGGSGNDEMTATNAPGPVVLDGAGGDDFLVGGSFADTLFGGAGSDFLQGVGGNDVLFDEDGEADELDGGDGDGDVAVSDPADGDPTDLVPNVEFDLADGTEDADPALVSGGTASLNNGVLTVTGTGAGDFIRLVLAQDGESVFVVEDPDRDADDGDPFVSEFALADVNSVAVNLGGGNDLYHGGEVAVDTQIDGGDGNDVLAGGPDNDAIDGGGGDDFMFGRGGDDVLDGGAGADHFSGGAGNDTADYSGRTGDVLVGIGQIPDDGERGEGDNVQADIETVIGGSGNDRFNTQGNGGVTFRGNAGRDSLLGGPGVDTFFAQDGEIDTIRGGAGTDLIGDVDDDDDFDLEN